MSIRLVDPEVPERTFEMTNKNLTPDKDASYRPHYERQIEDQIYRMVTEIYESEQQLNQLIERKGREDIETKVKQNEVKFKRVKLGVLRQNLVLFRELDPSKQQEISNGSRNRDVYERLDPNGQISTPPVSFR